MYCILALFLILEVLLRWTVSGDSMYRFRSFRSAFIPSVPPPGTTYFKAKGHPWMNPMPWKKLTRNKLGFRGKDLNMEKKQTNEFRVFIMGGSFLSDNYHGEDDCLTTLVQKKLDKDFNHLNVTVNTTAYSGENNSDLISVLVHQVAHLQPDLVIVNPELLSSNKKSLLAFPQFNQTVFMDALLALSSSVKIFQLLYLIYNAIKGHYNVIFKGTQYIQWDYSAMVAKTRNRPLTNDRLPLPAEDRTEGLLTIFDSVCKGIGCKLVVLLRDTRYDSEEVDDLQENKYFWTYTNQSPLRYRQHQFSLAYSAYHAMIAAKCRNRNLDILNLCGTVPKTEENWVDDTHVLNGVEIVANKISECIADFIESTKE